MCPPIVEYVEKIEAVPIEGSDKKRKRFQFECERALSDKRRKLLIK